MNKQLLLSAISVGLVSLGMSGNADAALVGRLAATPGGTDYQAYYDDVADLTWLADANYAVTSGYAAANASSSSEINTFGQMTFQGANDWVAQLSVNGATGWRLPTTLQPDSTCNGSASTGFGCTGSELGNLFYNVLGGTSQNDIVDAHNANYNLFSNIQSYTYWSGTVFDLSSAWSFSFSGGHQSASPKSSLVYAWAVRTGDVSAVPIPAAAWLFASGLLGLIGFARHKKA